MKHFIISALVLLSIACKSQTTDSTEIKLTRAKDLFIKNLITSQEYEQLRHQILGIETQKPQPVGQQTPKSLPNLDSLQIDQLWKNAKANLGGGSALLILSTGCWIGGAVVAANHSSGTAINPIEVILPIFSVAMFIPGVCLIVQGAKQKHRYYQYHPRELVINIKPDKIGLAYNF